MGICGSFLKDHPLICLPLGNSSSFIESRVSTPGVCGDPWIWSLVYVGGGPFPLSRGRVVGNFRGMVWDYLGGIGIINLAGI